MDDWLLITLIAVEMAFDAIVVAYLAALKTIPRFEKYLESEKGLKWFSKIAVMVKDLLNPEISKLELGMQEQVDGIRQDLQSSLGKIVIPEINLQQLREDLEASFAIELEDLKTGLEASMKISIDAGLQQLQVGILDSLQKREIQMRSAAARAMKGQLEGVDENVESLVEEMQHAFIGSGTTADLLKTEILGQQLPKNYAKQHPIGDLVVKLGKMTALQMLDSGQLSLPGNTAQGVINTQTVAKANPYGL
jgi:hypothetical protein